MFRSDVMLSINPVATRCRRCGGIIVHNYDEERCLNCAAEYDGAGNVVGHIATKEEQISLRQGRETSKGIIWG